MNKRIKLVIVTMLLSIVMLPTIGFAYVVDNQAVNYGNGNATNEFVLAHETANPNSTVYNEVAYMKNNWKSAHVTYYVGDGHVIQTAYPGKVVWGAGPYANGRSYAQVELARDREDPAMFAKNYPVYVNLLRDLARDAGIPNSLDTGGAGIKSHRWVSWNLGGTDHSDPYGFLAKMGISEAQFARDLQTGLPEKGYKPDVNKPTAPTAKPGNDNKSYTFNYQTKIRTSPGVNGGYTGYDYYPGQTVYYANVINKDGYNWMQYTTYSGQIRYVAQTNQSASTNKPVSTSGSYTFRNTTKIRTSAGLNGGYTGYNYYPGQTVYYDSTVKKDGYTWMSYIAYSGQRMYVTQTN